MKRILPIFCIPFLCLLLASCLSSSGKTKDAVVTIGTSTKFNKEEIDEAVNCVKNKFKDFGGCNLTELWYYEGKSDEQVASYMTGGKGSVNGVDRDNVIALVSNFTVDSSGGDGSFNPNSTYSNWNWVLIRDSSTGKWRTDDWGYG